MKKRIALLVVVMLLAVTFASAQVLACSACEVQDLLGTAVGQSGFYRLVEAVTVADLMDLLAEDGPFTLLAPSDEAFGQLPEGLWEELLADPERLAELLKSHMLPAQYSAAELLAFDGETLTTLAGTEISISADTTEVMINGVSMSATNILASNGLIHVLDAVLRP